MGALRTYQKGGHCGDGTHHLYATVLGGGRVVPTSTINTITTPSHWITDLNVRVDTATQDPPEVDLTWLLRHPFSFLPPVAHQDQCQLSPMALHDWLQEPPFRCGSDMRPVGGPTTPSGGGGGLPLDWFRDQRRHISAHRMDNIPAMTVLTHRLSHRDTVLDTTCLLCGTRQETAPHLWVCSAQSHEWRPARERLAAWLDRLCGAPGCACVHRAVEAGSFGAVGGCTTNPLHEASPHGLLRAPYVGDRVRAPRHQGVHPGLVRPRQGARHAAKGPAGCCRSYACTRRRRGRGSRGSSWANYD